MAKSKRQQQLATPKPTKYQKRNAEISNYRWKKWLIDESERRLKRDWPKKK